MPIRLLVLFLLRAAFQGRRALVIENLALRQQLAVLRRKVPHPRSRPADRSFWWLMRSLHDGWRDCLHLFKPETVIRWHRRGFRWTWGRMNQGHKQGRPTIGWKTFHLIRRLQRENPTWGAARITSELLMLGHTVGQTTVARYMKRLGPTGRSQPWMTFLRNHLKVTAACDFFSVPTVAFRNLYVFVVLNHDRRLIRHIAVTSNPTAEWTAREIAAAFPDGQADTTQYLLHDRAKLFGESFRRELAARAIEPRRTAARQPWQNGKCERVISTLRRECTDHLIVLSERQLLACLREYVEYYNGQRCHLALERDAPRPRRRETRPAAEVHGTPVLGGLHHVYRAVA